MNNRNLDSLLAELRQSRTPALPGSFSQDILRKIRASAKPVHDSDWFPALMLLFRPGLVVLALTVAVAVGLALPGIVRPVDQAMAVSGLDLNVFSTSSPNFPSGLLAKAR